MAMKKPHTISIPVEVYEPCDFTGGQYMVSSCPLTLSTIGKHMSGFGSGATLQEAETNYLEYTTKMGEFYRKQVAYLEKRAIFTKGNWKRRGGQWFSVLGLCFYFRYGNNMKHGWYVPFTKLNIMFTNYWKRKTTNE